MPKIEIRSTATAITGWEEQVIPANFGFLVKDGKNLYSEDHDSDSASRSFVGIKEDGTFVMVMNDGRQSPYSAGFNSYEMAEFMLSLGCVTAVNGDGGGSSTFLSQRPGEDLKINCSPSDGSERPTTHGILVISTAPATGEFVRASISAENEYFTPGSTVKFNAVGTDLVGTAAEIPADVTWQLADPSMGTISDGIFISNGKTGTATAQMVWNGEIVGEASVQIVIPEAISFAQDVITVPFGKEITINLKATINGGLNDVVLKESDIELTLDNSALGTLDGFKFTAVNEEAAPESLSGILNAALLHGEGLKATAKLSLGKGSKILYDFEDGDASQWAYYPNSKYNYIEYEGSTSLATREDGQVHSGNYALRLNTDFSVTTESGYLCGYVGLTGNERIDLKDATRIGMWIYFPHEAAGLRCHLRVEPVTERDADGNIVKTGGKYNSQSILDGDKDCGTPGFVTSFPESGWHYVSFDLTQLGDLGGCIPANATILQYYLCDRDGAKYNYSHFDYKSLIQNLTMYIDDVTIDYSSVVDDREAPIFSSVLLSDNGSNSDEPMSLNNGYVSNMSELSLAARVAENTTNANATGIDASTAKAYVDGTEVACKYTNGLMTIDTKDFSNGSHTIKFTICDRQGNYASAIRTFTVSAENNDRSTVKLVPHDAALDKILFGSLYYVDLVATDIETVQSVSVDLDLNDISIWQLDHMEAAEGFEASYSIIDSDDNIARVTITRTGESDATGEYSVVSMPIRTWELPAVESDYNPAGVVRMYDQYKKTNEIWPVDISVTVKAGTVFFNDGTNNTFAGDNVQVDTESYVWHDQNPKPDGYAVWNGGHDHRAETKQYYGEETTNHTDAVALPDAAATCTKDGYTGRTYCNECKSVVDWGTTVPATGHSFVTEGNIKICTACNKSYSADGLTGWQSLAGETYYFGNYSEVVDGQYTVDGHTYTFANSKLIDGAWENDGVGLTCWWAGEQLFNRWFKIGDNTYHFTGIYADTGFSRIAINTNVGSRYHMFDEHGVFCDDFNGIYIFNNNTYYLKDGIANVHGLVEYDGDYYYINSSYVAIKNTGYRLTDSMTNGLLPAGTYYFDADCKMIQMKNGIVTEDNGDIRYYVNDVPQYAGLVQDNAGNYYYINSTLKAVKNTAYTISAAKTNGLLPAGTYKFGADGKMIQAKNGIVKDDNGDVRYYVNDVPQYAGLVQDSDGSYYYINSTLKAVRNTAYTIGTAKTNGLLPAGTYNFGADGKMIQAKNGLVKDDNGDIRYYVDNKPQYAGLVQDDAGNYYYINSTLKAIKNTAYTIGAAKTNGLLPAGTYNFGADGKMIRVKNGLVKDDNGDIRYFIDNKPQYIGLVQDDDGNYYYINSTLKAVRGSSYTIGAAKTNGLLPAGTYHFGADGKMIP